MGKWYSQGQDENPGAAGSTNLSGTNLNVHTTAWMQEVEHQKQAPLGDAGAIAEDGPKGVVQGRTE